MTSNGNGVETIGARLKRLRHEKNLSQRDLAQPGVSYAYISRIEAGTRTPSVRALRKLAAALGVTEEYLEGGREHTTTDALLEELAARLDAPPNVITITREPEDGMYEIEFEYDGHRRLAGVSLTATVASVLVWLNRLEAIRAERLDLEERGRQIDASEQAALDKAAR